MSMFVDLKYVDRLFFLCVFFYLQVENEQMWEATLKGFLLLATNYMKLHGQVEAPQTLC